MKSAEKLVQVCPELVEEDSACQKKLMVIIIFYYIQLIFVGLSTNNLGSGG